MVFWRAKGHQQWNPQSTQKLWNWLVGNVKDCSAEGKNASASYPCLLSTSFLAVYQFLGSLLVPIFLFKQCGEQMKNVFK